MNRGERQTNSLKSCSIASEKPLVERSYKLLFCFLFALFFFFLSPLFHHCSAFSYDVTKITGSSCGDDRVMEVLTNLFIPVTFFVQNVERPISSKMTKEMLFSMDNTPNIQLLKTHFTRQGRLTVDAALELVSRARAIFDTEPNMLEIDVPVTSLFHYLR